MFSFPVEKDILLKEYTTFKIGGKADYFYAAKSYTSLIKAMEEAKQNNLPFFVLGNGSNILVSDAGFRGLVIKMEINELDKNGLEITAGAGVTIGSLLNFCKESNLSGLEFLSGIPATVGGAIWANIGAAANSIGNFVHEILILDKNNEVKKISGAKAQFKYRDSIFKRQSFVILEVVFLLAAEKREIIEKKMKEFAQKKIKEQDTQNPSAGSVFKNPPGHKAWELIDKAGLRGFKIGNAQVSEKHANFIVNTGQATASDVVMLISLIKQKVRDNLGVQLMEEIKYIGF